METQVNEVKLLIFQEIQYLGSILFWGCVLENVFSPKGWPKNLPNDENA